MQTLKADIFNDYITQESHEVLLYGYCEACREVEA